MDLHDPAAHRAGGHNARAEQAFGGDRDARLVTALRRLHDQRHADRIEVAVRYGAGPRARRRPRSYGYRPRSAEWLTVATL